MVEQKPRLAGKVAIVTGAGSVGPAMGNGKAVAIQFARQGAKVLLVDRVTDLAEDTKKWIESEGGIASAFTADVTKAKDCQAMVAAAVERYGRLDILHNNVGIRGAIGTVVELGEDNWDNVMATNLKSVMLASKFAIPQMIKGGGGAIINISSAVGVARPYHSAPYTASKGGVVALTHAMAVDHAPDHVRVNCIAVGSVFTPKATQGMTEEVRDARRRDSPLELEGTSWDISWAAVYLASDEARWVTGIVLPVEGGLTLTRRGGQEAAEAKSRELT